MAKELTEAEKKEHIEAAGYSLRTVWVANDSDEWFETLDDIWDYLVQEVFDNTEEGDEEP